MSSITFGDNSSLERIGYSAFSYSTITSIKIPASVTAIGDHAFEECGDLTAVYVLPTTPPSIEDSFVDINGSCHFYLHGAEYDNDNDWQNEVINTYGHTTVYSLALGSGITTTPSASFTAYGRSYYTANTSITINSEVPAGYQSGSFAGYTKNNVSLVGNTFDMPAQDVRIRAIWTPIEWEGTGAENDPYMIVYPSQLDLLSQRVNAGTDYTGKYFKLGNDITYSYVGYGPTESNYTGIGKLIFDPYQNNEPEFIGFNGTFDGNGKTIRGIRMYESDYMSTMVCPGIFNLISNHGVVKNLTVQDTKISAEACAGGIVGMIYQGSVQNCISYADLYVIKANVMNGLIGGIAGESILGSISNCTSYSTITIGDNYENCQYVGGIVGGVQMGVTDNCYSYSSIIIGDDASDFIGFGGITGIVEEGSITNCFSSTTIEFGDNFSRITDLGGIAGIVDEGCVSGNIVVGVNLPNLATAGAIFGSDEDDPIYSNNYYSNCTVGVHSENIGCYASDITTDDGAVQATILLETEDAPATLANGEKVVFRREFKQGVSSTVCLPVAIDESLASLVGKFFTFAGVDMTDPDDWTVVMQEVAGNNMVDGDLQANTPYLFIPDADGPVLFIGEADGSSVAAGNATNGNWTFKGTYESIEWNAGNANLGKVYGFAAQKYEAPDNNGDSNPDYTINPGKFVMAGAGASIAPYRSYLMYNPVLSAPSRSGSRTDQQLPGSMKVVLLSSTGIETAVGRINTATGDISIDSWYDMSGRQIQGVPTNGGMYINGGKTIMINK